MSQVGDQIRIIPATESDVPLILSFVRKLAEYEKLANRVVANEATLRDSLFGARPAAEVMLAYLGTRAAGFAVFFENFSTFAGRRGVYLEDLFVEPEFRSKGIGKALLMRLAQLTRQRGGGRLDWAVLNWNKPAIGFYRKLGAEPMADWTVYRLSGDALDALGTSR